MDNKASFTWNFGIVVNIGYAIFALIGYQEMIINED